jgi:Lsr2
VTVRIQIILVDNLDEHDGTLTDIGNDGETHVVSLDGVVRELHLTKEHSDQLREDMALYLAAGHQPGAQPEMPPLPGSAEAEREQLKGQGRRREIPGTRDFYRELREWAAEAGIDIPVSAKRPGKNNYKYGGVLSRYLAHLEETAAAGRDGGTAAVRLDMARRLGLRGAPAHTGNGLVPAG